MRKPFQGVLNIIRFNWVIYIVTLILILGILLIAIITGATFLYLVLAVISFQTLVTLSVSYYVYDYSDLYSLAWLEVSSSGSETVLMVHAGFDEFSNQMKVLYPKYNLLIWDMYDPLIHTEPSVRRARNRYPNPEGKVSVDYRSLPEIDDQDDILLLFSAHEIRDQKQRISFFKQLKNSLADGGKIHLVEHERDVANLIAFNIGAFHFYSRHDWQQTIRKSGLKVDQRNMLNPFVTYYQITTL